MKYFIGIDPGLSGAVVVIDARSNIVAWCDCPIYQGESDIKRHDSKEMLNFLIPYTGNACAILELVRIDQRDAGHLISAEKLIRTHEAWRTLLDACSIPTEHLYPVQWRKPLDLSGDDGGVYVEAAMLEFPEARSFVYYQSKNGRWAKNHNRAEALLMARVCQMKFMEVAA